jgi:hypothetical protein
MQFIGPFRSIMLGKLQAPVLQHIVILYNKMKLVVMPRYNLLDMLDIVVRHKVTHLL